MHVDAILAQLVLVEYMNVYALGITYVRVGVACYLDDQLCVGVTES